MHDATATFTQPEVLTRKEHNKAAVDAYLQRVAGLEEAEYEGWASKPSPAMQRLRALRAAREQRSA